MVSRDPEERLFLEERLRQQYSLKEKGEYFNALSLEELRGLKADYQKLGGTIEPIHFRLLMKEIDEAYWRGDSQ
ncbi:MAG TPA: hypothetical protein VJC21_00375 [Candidatus Nanoarchaeia archaeon]|nr:hypothetical protein [Candidatus Nanoarchaeia archaeon]